MFVTRYHKLMGSLSHYKINGFPETIINFTVYFVVDLSIYLNSCITGSTEARIPLLYNMIRPCE